MSGTITAFVEKLNSKTGQGARGPWTAYSMKVQTEDGTVLPDWYQLGFTSPAFEEGSFIKFDWTLDGKYRKVDQSTVKVSKAKTAADKPTSEYAAKSGGGSGGGGYAAAKVKTSELFGEIGGYNTEDDIRRMSWGNCRDAAISLVGILLANDALPMSVADSKAGKTKRFEEIEAYVAKKTVELYFDAATGRVIDQVGDAGVVEDSIPEGVPGQEDFATPAVEEFEDDEFE
jgi:hypothetical protein